jgi:nicotinate-nucleotide adenylyltransferase
MINWPIILPELSPETAQSLLDLVGARYPFSPYHEELKHICPELLFTQDSEEWVFFGGSFNPWHKGHQACLDLLPEDKLCFILPDRSPLKELKVIEPVATILELITKIKFRKHHYIAPTFLLDFQQNPTVTWVEKLQKDFPKKKISLLIGFDSFRGILKWVRSEELLNVLHGLYVVSRMEDKEERDDVANPVRALAKDLNITFLGGHKFEDISSTELRNKT